MKTVLLVIFFCYAGSAFAYTDSAALQQHRLNNDLESWIYARIAYVEKDPVNRIDFLMRTQQEVWRSYQTYRERLVWFDLLSLQGYYQLQTGNILASISAYEAALSFYESYPLPDADIIETVLKPLGNNYTRLADYNTALFIHRKTLKLATDDATKASVYSNMAICARWQGNYDEAIGYCKTSWQYKKSTPVLSTWADVLAEQNKFDSAIILLKQAPKNLLVEAKIAFRLGNYKQALLSAQQAMPGMQRPREKAKLHLLLGDIYLKMGAPTEALAEYKQVVSSAGDNTLADALSGTAAALEALHQPQAALQNYLASFKAERQLRSAFYYNESKLRELQVTRPRVEAAIKLAYRLKDFKQLLLIAEISRAQVLMDERRSRTAKSDTILRLQSAINYYQHELLNDPKVAPLLQATEYQLSMLEKKTKKEEGLLTIAQLDNIIKQLPAGVTALEFFAGKDSSFIIELTQKGILNVYPIVNDTILPFMQRWFANGPANMINAPKQFYRSCHHLYKTIFGNYTFNKQTHYLLLPDGAFNYLPFDALITDSTYRNNYGQWPYLCKQATLSQAWSLQTWHEQQTMSYTTGTFAGFFVSPANQPALSIQKEYKALQQQVKGRFYINNSATVAAFNKATDSAGILHISTHALASHLELYDKPYYLFDLRYKHFAPSLVVLGACKTADGDLLEGEGVNSISRAFTAAGAGGVVSGLWNVNDEAAITMMQFFYDHLQKNNAAQSLHKAKEEWLQKEHENKLVLLPYYWGGFVYSGHLQKIEMEKTASYAIYYWLIGGMLLLFIIIKCI